MGRSGEGKKGDVKWEGAVRKGRCGAGRSGEGREKVWSGKER